MKTKVKMIVKCLAFVLLTCAIVGGVNAALTPGYYYNETWSTTNTYKDFYALKKNSVDVLFFGSSHAVSTLNPQVVYDNYGITSYNLGSEQQSMVVSYYWLREALKYQNPKVVVIDTYMLFKNIDGYVENELNCSEGAVRKAMDSMRFSPLKCEAAKTIEKLDPTQNGLSYIFTNIRYHSRWTSLGEKDFVADEMLDHKAVKGFSVQGGTNPDIQYSPINASDAMQTEGANMEKTPKEYMDKIVELCNAEGIELVLVNIPSYSTAEMYKSTREYAESKAVPYYDFNEEVLFNEIEYNPQENLLGHPNYEGARKVSMYIGKLLADEYRVEAREDSTYDISRINYEHKVKNIELGQTNDIYQYLDMLQDDNYCVFVFGPKEFGEYIDSDIEQKLQSLGLKSMLAGVQNGMHYCAVIDSDGIVEDLSEGNVNLTGSIRGGYTLYSFIIDKSKLAEKTHIYSLKIDGQECGNKLNGLNFVVYDKDMKMVVDKVNFDTSLEDKPASRY